MSTTRIYDLAIVGGGLAGLSLSILMARNGRRVVLFEKETYPFHKVCGEYVSMESHDFLCNLGLPLDEWQLPLINKLYITSPNGEFIRANLPLGGFGISRFKLDSALANIAKDKGVTVFENTKVYDSQFKDGIHYIQTSAGLFSAPVMAACYGKKSNLDVKWKRRFVRNDKGTNFIGVKYMSGQICQNRRLHFIILLVDIAESQKLK